MATVEQLCEQGRLVRIEVELDPDEMSKRRLYGCLRVETWLNDRLPEIESDGYVPGAPSPADQADTLFYQYITGDGLRSMPPKCLTPNTAGVWELRTADLRFFGWFWRRGTFIISSAEQTSKCKEIAGLYGGHRDQAKRDRENLGLDKPEFINGDLHDLF